MSAWLIDNPRAWAHCSLRPTLGSATGVEERSQPCAAPVAADALRGGPPERKEGRPLMKAATCRRIAWVANALCLAAVLIFLGYDIKYGLPRYDTSSFLWSIADWLGPLVVVLIALVAALVNMTLASCRDPRRRCTPCCTSGRPGPSSHQSGSCDSADSASGACRRRCDPEGNTNDVGRDVRLCRPHAVSASLEGFASGSTNSDNRGPLSRSARACTCGKPKWKGNRAACGGTAASAVGLSSWQLPQKP